MRTKQTSNWHSTQSPSAIYIRSMNDIRWHESTNPERFDIYLETLCGDFESDVLPVDPVEKNIKEMALKEAKDQSKQFSYETLPEMKPSLEWFYDNFWQFLDLADEELREDAPLQDYEEDDTGPLCSII